MKEEETSSFQSKKKNWVVAECRTDEIVDRIRPTLVDDQKRREVIHFVRHLITSALAACQVFPYGSVPLKTYLPDGDIDLTAITNPNFEETLVSDVNAVLAAAAEDKSSPFQLRDVHCIDAEVKLVKCLVDNIVVDISFNQLGGLCTLCFLEQVDDIIGRDHLFKRSIILIKAWCYYESRILGSHHGLISTYALETLVLYIFHLFHSSLEGPLAVLYQFLDYFSKFDWENYCVSLSGPVCKSSLPDIMVLENGRDDLLLSEEFLQECTAKFSVPSRGMETNSRAFPQKHLNIIDALKANNNLGRSVNRGNYHRICSAFKYGAHKLGQILSLPSERLVDQLDKFFTNTLERHESEYQTDVQDFSSSADHSSSTQNSERCHEDSMFFKSLVAGYSNKIASAPPSCNGKLDNGSPHRIMPSKSFADDDRSCALWPEFKENSSVASGSVCSYIHENKIPNNLSWPSPVPSVSDHSSSGFRERNLASILRSSEPSKSLLDLNGHYDSFFSNLVYGKHYYLSAPVLLSPSMSKSAFISEGKKKSRGTGTYFPKMNYRSTMSTPLSRREKFQALGTHRQLQRYTLKNALVSAPTEMNLYGEGNHELSQEEYPVLGDINVPFPQVSTPPSSSHLWDSASSPMVPLAQGADSVAENNQDRATEQSYHLKNEADFPPLSH